MLDGWRAGDARARDALFAEVYPEMELAAAALLRREGRISLSTGDLVHEAFLRLVRLDRIAWADRPHFLAMAARFMRRVLVDHARGRSAGKRAHQRVGLTTRFDAAGAIDLDELDHALIRLAAIDPGMGDLVEMRYFGGMTLAEVGKVLAISEATALRRWRVARAWLLDALG
ncbi:ECF-type sigma factor [Sphingomonas sp. 1P06PA]|uniref:ECF-type sigma factor n=1 Tax=Sphingomonas sp. 1P06PA TaxID=554121 RepID=UPI0039A5D0CD